MINGQRAVVFLCMSAADERVKYARKQRIVINFHFRRLSSDE